MNYVGFELLLVCLMPDKTWLISSKNFKSGDRVCENGIPIGVSSCHTREAAGRMGKLLHFSYISIGGTGE